MSLEEGGHTPVRHSVPDLDAAICGAADEVFARVAPPETRYIQALCIETTYPYAAKNQRKARNAPTTTALGAMSWFFIA